MFTTCELFGKFHSPRKPVSAFLHQVRHYPLHRLETLCATWISAARLAPNEAGPHSRQRIFTPKLTFLTFLSQVLHPGASCRKAVGELQNYYLLQPEPRHISGKTSPYCQARLGLSLDTLVGIRNDLSQRMARALPSDQWQWERPVKVVDGSTVSMPDSPENQAEYPQTSSQKAGCGFPQIRLLALFSLDTGALLECTHGPCATSEVKLFHQVWSRLEANDLLLGDRLFGSYTTMARLFDQGIDGSFRLNSQRDHDFRRGQRLGHHDRLMTWYKPRQKPAGLSDEEWAKVPAQIVVREVKVPITDPSCRVKEMVLVTTLLDPKKWSKARLAALLARRWQVELNLDDLKTSLQMDVLSCLSPAMIQRELQLHLIAFNLVRALMLEASVSCHAPLDRLSFKGTLDRMEEFSQSMARVPRSHHQKRLVLYQEMLAAIAEDLVPLRPGRREPRCLKRRPKAYPFMTKPRRKMKDAPKSSRRKPKKHAVAN